MSAKGHLPDKSQRVTADDLFDLSTTPTSLSPIVRTGAPVVSMATLVDAHPLKTVEVSSRHDDMTLLISESYQQLCATFSRAMAHAGYIPLCRLLGQVRG